MTKAAGLVFAVIVSATGLLLAPAGGLWLAAHAMPLPAWFTPATITFTALTLGLAALKNRREELAIRDAPIAPHKRQPIKGSRQL